MKALEQRTVNIIMCCKGKGVGETSEDRIVRYLSKECACSEEEYTTPILSNIITDAFLDFIDCCDNPRFEMWKYYKDIFNREYYKKEYELMLICFELCQVRNNENYVNGFTAESVKEAYNELR